MKYSLPKPYYTNQAGAGLLAAIMIVAGVSLMILYSSLDTSNTLKSESANQNAISLQNVRRTIERNIDCNATVFLSNASTTCQLSDDYKIYSFKIDGVTTETFGTLKTLPDNKEYHAVQAHTSSNSDVFWLFKPRCVDGAIVIDSAKYDFSTSSFVKDPLTKRPYDFNHGKSRLVHQDMGMCSEYFELVDGVYNKVVPEDAVDVVEATSTPIDTSNPVSTYISMGWDRKFCGTPQEKAYNEGKNNRCTPTYPLVNALPVQGGSSESFLIAGSTFSDNKHTSGSHNWLNTWPVLGSQSIKANGDLMLLDVNVPFEYEGDTYSNYNASTEQSKYCHEPNSDNNITISIAVITMNGSTVVNNTRLSYQSGACQRVKSTFRRRIPIATEAGKTYNVSVHFRLNNWYANMDTFPVGSDQWNHAESCKYIEPKCNFDTWWQNDINLGPVRLNAISYQYQVPEIP